MKKILWSILGIVLILEQKRCHPDEDKMRQLVTLGTPKDPRSMEVSACVVMYKCVIFLRNNYNFDIPAVANALLKRHREIRQKEFICKPCYKQLKDGKYSMFGSNLNHEQDDQDKVHGSRTDHDNTMPWFLLTLYNPEYYIDKLLSVYMFP